MGAEAETFTEAEKAYKIGDTEKAFKIWSELAAMNDPAIQYYLGTLYMMNELPMQKITELISENKLPIQEENIGIDKSRYYNV